MELANRIIDYLSGNELRLGRVVREQASKLQVEDTNGRVGRVNPRNVLAVHGVTGSTDSSVRIAQVQGQIDDLAEEVDTELLWESVVDDGGERSVGVLAQEYFGESGSLHLSALARELLADDERFKRRGLEFSPRSREEAEEARLRAQREAARAEARKQATEWVEQTLRSPQNVNVPDDLADFVRQIEDFMLRGHNNDASRILCELRKGDAARDAGLTILEALGRLPDDADPFLLRKGVFAGFSESVEGHAASLAPYAPDSSRLELTHLTAFSIDDEDTREVDDALSVEMEGDATVVGIHIADPASFVHRGDPLDTAASARPLTLYLPTTTVTMLPGRVGCDLASLAAGEVRPAMSFRVRFDATGQLVDWEAGRSQVRVARRMTYEQADAMLANAEGEGAADFARLLTIATALRDEREADGALRLFRPELKVRVLDGRIDVTAIDSNTPSHLVVSELMVLANRLVAQYALRNDVPVIYRAQDPPASRIPLMDSYDPVAFGNAVRQLQRSRLSTHPQRHAALGLDVYTQASSPIRRYADLVTQRQVTAALAGDDLPYTVEEMIEVLGAADRMEGENKRLEREATRYWLLEHLRRDHMETLFEATVLPGGRNGPEAEIERYFLRGRLSGSGHVKPGMRLTVKVAEVKPGHDWLVFRPA